MSEDTAIHYCAYKRGTGDQRYPVLCTKNGKRGYYVTARQCSECANRRRGNEDA